MTFSATGFLGGESFGDTKLSKHNEVSTSKSISPTAPDEYENKIMNIGGNA